MIAQTKTQAPRLGQEEKQRLYELMQQTEKLEGLIAVVMEDCPSVDLQLMRNHIRKARGCGQSYFNRRMGYIGGKRI